MLNRFSIDQAEEWDIIVRSFSDYDVYWLSGYVHAFQLHGDGEPILFYYEGKSTRGINVVMKRDIASTECFENVLEKNKYYDFTTPYGYGGWLIEGDATILLSDYEAWCRENHIISEFVRFHPVLKNHSLVAGAYDVIPLGETVVMDLSSSGIIWENTTSKNRNKIRKAQKNGIHIYNGRCPQFFETFRTIYNSTMDKDQADAYYYFGEAFYKSILEDLPLNAQIFYAEYQGQVIASSIMLAVNGKMNYHLSGSLKSFQHLAPTNLLLYHAALWGYANGYKSLYLGGGVGSEEDSLLTFKRAFFRGELNRFYIGKKIFNQGVYDKLVEMRNDIPSESNFFPKYRA
jgi:hypothetical protein